MESLVSLGVYRIIFGAVHLNQYAIEYGVEKIIEI